MTWPENKPLSAANLTDLENRIDIANANIVAGKDSIYNAIIGKGVTPAGKDFSQLVNGISMLGKFASGTGGDGYPKASPPTIWTVTGLTFRPSKLLVVVTWEDLSRNVRPVVYMFNIANRSKICWYGSGPTFDSNVSWANVVFNADGFTLTENAYLRYYDSTFGWYWVSFAWYAWDY